jgi:hypothetical protein
MYNQKIKKGGGVEWGVYLLGNGRKKCVYKYYFKTCTQKNMLQVTVIIMYK